MAAAVDKSGALRMSYVCQLLLCLYGSRFSYVAIRNLRKYEETTKKAAEWSQTVQDHLDKTRTTQATGAISLLTTLVSSGFLLTGSHLLPSWAPLTISASMLLATIFMRSHVKKYWAPYKGQDGKDIGTRVPLPNMADYNEAEFMTERLLEVMKYLEYSWFLTSLFVGFGF